MALPNQKESGFDYLEQTLEPLNKMTTDTADIFLAGLESRTNVRLTSAQRIVGLSFLCKLPEGSTLMDFVATAKCFEPLSVFANEVEREFMRMPCVELHP